MLADTQLRTASEEELKNLRHRISDELTRRRAGGEPSPEAPPVSYWSSRERTPTVGYRPRCGATFAKTVRGLNEGLIGTSATTNKGGRGSCT
jgi:hypothetical protein